VGSEHAANTFVVPSQTMNSTKGGGNVSAVGEELLTRNSSARPLVAASNKAAPAMADRCLDTVI
jgi:hypothetical protein